MRRTKGQHRLLTALICAPLLLAACGDAPQSRRKCGNGLLTIGEECDDGNTTPGDGCDAGCANDSTGCAIGPALECGDATFGYNSGAGSTNDATQYACSTVDATGPEVTYLFAAAANATVTVDLTDMTDDLDIYVLSDATDICDPTACMAYGDNSVTFGVTADATYLLVVDGIAGAVSEYTLSVSCTP